MGSNHSKSRTTGPAFTFIELLVVIAIVAVLAALLLPALSRAKRAAQGVRCKSNLRQLVLAVNLYTTDHGVYPAVALYYPNRGGAGLDELLRPYTSSGWLDPLYQCPGFHGAVYVGQYSAAPNALGMHGAAGSYGYNSGGWARDWGLARGASVDADWPVPVRPVREAEVIVPSDMFALGDAIICWPTVTKAERPGYAGDWDPWMYYSRRNSEIMLDNKYVNGLAGEEASEQARHNGIDNVALCDGHIEGLKPRALLSTNVTAMRRWHYDHEPHREIFGPPWLPNPGKFNFSW